MFSQRLNKVTGTQVALLIALTALAGCSGGGDGNSTIGSPGGGSGGSDDDPPTSGLSGYVAKPSEVPSGWEYMPSSQMDSYGITFMDTNPGEIDVEEMFEGDEMEPMPQSGYGAFYWQEEDESAIFSFAVKFSSTSAMEDGMDSNSPCDDNDSFVFDKGAIAAGISGVGVEASTTNSVGTKVMNRVDGDERCRATA